MKILIIALISVISITVNGQMNFDIAINQIEDAETLAIYSLEYVQDSTRPDFVRQEDMLLFMGKETSLFTGEGKYTFDTTMRKITTDEQFSKYAASGTVPITPFKYRIIKNYPTGKITQFDYIIGDNFRYEEDLSLIKWNIFPDTATINGYLSQKATCSFAGREWIAWFSTEIPYSDGPYKFNGLPGLILNIQDSKSHYVFTLLSFERLAEDYSIDFEEKDYLLTTKKGFFKAVDYFRNDIINRAEEAGFSSNQQQQIANKMRSRNNPLELKRD